MLVRQGDIPLISLSRFNRRLHPLPDWLYGKVVALGEIFAQKGYLADTDRAAIFEQTGVCLVTLRRKNISNQDNIINQRHHPNLTIRRVSQIWKTGIEIAVEQEYVQGYRMRGDGVFSEDFQDVFHNSLRIKR